MTVLSNGTDIFVNKLVIPFLSTAFNIVSILGGLALWALILWGIVKIVEAKLGPTGWARASALTGLIEHFKWFIIGIATFYVLMYVVAYLMNWLGASVNPAEFVTKLLLEMLFKPFMIIYKQIVK